MDQQLGLNKESRMSPQKENQLALLSVKLPYGEAKKVYTELTGQSTGRMTTHRTVQRISVRIQKGKKVKMESVFQQPTAGVKKHASGDGTMIHIRREGWKEAKVGACYEVNEDGKAQGMQYVATLGERKEFGEKLYQLAGQPCLEQTRRSVFISDGAEWLSELQQEHFPQATAIIDFYHASEYIWKVARAFYGEGTLKANICAGDWIGFLKKGRQKRLKLSLSHLQPRNKDQREILLTTKRYFKNHGHKMNYPKYKADGCHIGSGIIEGACKHVIGDRMKRSGMRWSRPGAENLLKLRTIYLNHQWEQLLLCHQN